MMFENFPTPEDIVPEAFAAPPMDAKWVEATMNEVAATLRKNSRELKANRSVRFMPIPMRDMGHAAEQWQHYSGHIADLVRQNGWAVTHIKSSVAVPTLLIDMPKKDKSR